MSNRRFMINARSIRNGFASFDGELFNHIVRVLRLGTGTSVMLVDERGNEHQGVIDQVDRDWVVVKIIATLPPPDSVSSTTRLTICQALPKGEKTDLILQKCTELGAHDFWLFGGRRSVAKIREEQLNGKLERWGKITSEAARQCCRRDIPAVSWFSTAVEAADATSHEVRLLLWEGERKQHLKQIVSSLQPPASVIIAIGPEGGFDPLEVRHFSKHGFIPVSLGDRILRTETAALAITSILQYIWEDN
ncbi:MAG TPA: 16S rRNA (uracil(1498)-N(3))-methyltransferase [Deltaproteobacteria bacterium]|nr:16S rRNA (uracil(1498)-N(3))-methyltransferase [Deltaproteobacteria bacterium]HQB39579.1 16S rRNA (uracil(1498)-N(3))-methyltransferase [Deltaproteobacteria bacterium]